MRCRIGITVVIGITPSVSHIVGLLADYYKLLMFATTGVDEKILSENAQEEVIEVMNGCMYVIYFCILSCSIYWISDCLFVDQSFRTDSIHV